MEGKRREMAIYKVTTNAQVTIPKEIREEVHLAEGDLIEFAVRDGCVIIIPKKAIDADQAYFWTSEWQKKETEVEDALDKGEYKEFRTVEDLIKDLHS
jgi:AbrB family looped-hinge helix DNA binding protein